MDVSDKTYRAYGEGIGNEQTLIGKLLRHNRLNQQYLVDISKVNKNTISKLCTDIEFTPTNKLMSRIIGSLRQQNHDVSVVDFWNYDPLNAFDLSFG
ncbi:hypothetical protein [Paenibacillus sp. YAF4_2]|uniref:hypothetical protein n=1 Tax=Paenibacillus sp. YAF4_2 TaxID=3233085 RepID=UPI003F9B224A